MTEEKRDYLKIARNVFDAGTSYTSEQDKERSQNAQAAALIAIAETLEKILDLMTPKSSKSPTPRPEPSGEGELAKKPHPERGEK